MSEELGDLNVSRETLDRLKEYERLLHKWNARINLVSRKSMEKAWGRHFVDSAQIAMQKLPAKGRWLDLGSGGGFPGLVVAIILQETKPLLKVTLVESDTRKAVFLETVVREFGLDVTIHPERIERLAPQSADVISARALAPLTDLLSYAEPHLAPKGMCLFMKGAGAESELTEARKLWHIDAEAYPSKTDPTGAIIRIGAFHRV